MKQRRKIVLLVIALVLSCSGCAARGSRKSIPTVSGALVQTETVPTDHGVAAPERENPESAEKLLEIAAISGSVVEISNSGCKITPTRYEENVAYEAAPGYETELVMIEYCDGCTFQIANVNLQTGSITYEPAGVENVGRQMSLVVCGEYDEGGVLQGERVFIYRTVR